jgi:hypothetical protein
MARMALISTSLFRTACLPVRHRAYTARQPNDVTAKAPAALPMGADVNLALANSGRVRELKACISQTITYLPTTILDK